MKENYKEFNLETRDDCIIYLRYLIQLAHRQLYYYKHFIEDMELEFKKLEPSKKINGLKFESLRCRVVFLTMYLFNLFGDESKGAMSYRKFRKVVERNSKFDLKPLNESIKKLINEFNTARNWSSHIPESYLYAEFEAAKKHNKKFTREAVLQLPSPVVVTIHVEHSIDWLDNIIKACKENQQDFKLVFQQMKKDFSILIGESMAVDMKYATETDILSYHNDIPGISIQMQNKNYRSNP